MSFFEILGYVKQDIERWRKKKRQQYIDERLRMLLPHRDEPHAIVFRETYTLTSTESDFWFPFTAIHCEIDNERYGTWDALLKFNPDSPEAKFVKIEKGEVLPIANIPGGINGFRGYCAVSGQETKIQVLMVRKGEGEE